MRAMKDSGVEWIGQIPSIWNRIPLKRWLSSREGGAWGDEATGDENDVVCIRVADFDYPKLSIKSEGEFTLRHYDVRVIENLALSDGDILVEKSGGGEKTPVGRAVMHQGSTRALFANFMDRLRILPSQSARYFLYVWTAFYQNGHVSPYIKQTTGIQNLDLTAMLSVVSAPKPDITEQKRIASFLDAKCAQIDAIIEKQQQVIEKLKAYKQSVITEAVTKGLNPTVPMKDSGVEWIGMIPESWAISKVKYVAIFNPACDEKIDPDRIVGYAPMDCIKNGFMMPQEIQYSSVSSGLTYFENDDVVMAKVTPCFENGNIAIASDLTNGCAFGSSELFVFRCHGIRTRFLFYYLQNDDFKQECISTMAGTGGLKRVSPSYVRNSYIPLPNEIIQDEIIGYLDSMSASLNSAIAKKQTIIDKLTDYKKSLIYEAVTGKMEV